MRVDVQQLSSVLADRILVPSVRLTPVDVRCAWPVFRAEAPARPPMFVKVVDWPAAERTLAFLRSVPPRPFLPHCVLEAPFEYDGYAVLCLEWKQVRCVNAEDMSDAQAASFVDVCCGLSAVLAGYRGPLAAEAEDDPGVQYASLSGYVARRTLSRPLVKRLLASLLSVPNADRTYGARARTVIHGDFQPRNYGFDGDRLSAVFDFDALTTGFACEDAAYAFTERARRLDLSRAVRCRLTELFLRVVVDSPWPVSEWRFAVNHARLRIAARRLERHPDSAFVAFDIWRRDRPLRALAQALEDRDA